MPYEYTLQSEKYWLVAVKQELKHIRQQKNRNALKAFGLFLFAVSVILVTGYAVQTMPVWLNAVSESMAHYFSG